MAARRATKPRRSTRERSGRPRRKKISPLTIGKIDYVDYKDVGLLNKFVSDRAKLKPRFNSGNDAQQQRTVARAVKNAREMALLPYTQRLTTQRRERRGERGARAAGPPPLPTAPPPGSSGEQGEPDVLLSEEETVELDETLSEEETVELDETLSEEETVELDETLSEEETVEPDAVEPTEVAEVTTDEVTGGEVEVEATDGEAEDVAEAPDTEALTSSDDEDVQG
jgi:small subunit ribosomal protein S18